MFPRPITTFQGPRQPWGTVRFHHISSRVRLSRVFAPTLKPESGPASDYSSLGHRFLVRAGFVRPSSTGIYTLLPLGQRVLGHLERLVDRIMVERLEAHKLGLAHLLPATLWKRSGRWVTTGKELFRLTDRKQTDYCLGPTHEEEITQLIAREVTSHRQLPLRLYQVGRKFRDEVRPRSGLLRAREFVMKDLYSFDVDSTSAQETYDQVRLAYRQFFDHLGVAYLEAKADSGNIGGSLSHEFHLPASIGEDVLLQCGQCGYTANQECADVVIMPDGTASIESTPGDTWIDFVTRLPSLIFPPTGQSAKEKLRDIHQKVAHLPVTVQWGKYETVTGSSSSTWIMAILPQGRTLNSIKLDKKIPHHGEWHPLSWEALTASSIPSNEKEHPPLQHKASEDNSWVIAVDRRVADMLPTTHPWRTNPTTAHAEESNLEFSRRVFVDDFALALPGDICAHCHSSEGSAPIADAKPTLEQVRAIEVGHTFYLGTKYSKTLGALVQPPNDSQTSKPPRQVPIEMGCYGLGLSRIVGALADTHHDKQGIRWPPAIAPYRLCIMPIIPKSEMKSLCPTWDGTSPLKSHHVDHPVWRAMTSLYDHLQDRVPAQQWQAWVSANDPGTYNPNQPTQSNTPRLSRYWNNHLVIDDRLHLSPGQRFKDAELIGFPWLLVIGKQFIQNNKVELHDRRDQSKYVVTVEEALEYLDQQATVAEGMD
ncbi:hypothetical protein IWQ62_003757 [Dispira parvispora]|uniref:proline--tRNA ligase n=1 Tax=Dispira parvispora TaxID=1520584 RepID=A0A9W8E1C2_9FUNG|nr:hypothetical protein IWQ62_003757 [Dispira parvispora]